MNFCTNGKDEVDRTLDHPDTKKSKQAFEYSYTEETVLIITRSVYDEERRFTKPLFLTRTH